MLKSITILEVQLALGKNFPFNEIKNGLENEEEQGTEYTTGHYIVDTDVLTVRSSPKIEENNWLRYSQLTSNAQKQVYEKSGYKPNGLVKGVECDVSEIVVADSYIWGRIPSGWIALEYCKKG